ncbi:MAG: PAS domain S-box protein [Acidobacteriia bacterium]|nr:PAS domain S-box protein [Terriglobia bacterium]
MKWSIGGKVISAFGLALLILISINVISYRTTTRLVKNTQLESQSFRQLEILVALTARLTDAESGQRGYLITGDESYLRPYYGALSGVDQQIEDFRKLNDDDPEELPRVDVLQSLVRQRLLLLQKSIDLKKENPSISASEIALLEEGRKLHEQVRKLILEMKDHENEVFLQRSKEEKVTARNAEVVITLGGLLSIGLVAGAIFIIHRDIGQRLRAEESLRHLSSILEATPDFVGSADMQGRALSVNKAGRKMRGISEDVDVSGLLIADFHPPWAAKIVKKEGIPTAIREGTWAGETALLGRDGREIPVSQVIIAHKSKGGQTEYLSTIARDITDRQQAQLALQKARDELEVRVQERTAELAKTNEALLSVNRALRMISECNQVLVHSSNEKELLANICRALVEIGGYCLAWIGFAQQDERKTVRRVASGGDEQGYLESLDVTWGEDERGQGPTGKAIRSGEPVISRDLLSDPNFKPWREEIARRRFVTSIALPLMTGGTPLGALNIYSRTPDAFDVAEVNLLTELANDLVYGITALRTQAERERAMKALQESEERFRLLVLGVEDYAIFMLDPDGRVVSWSTAAERMQGYSTDEIVGRHFSLLYTASDLKRDWPKRLLEMAKAKGYVKDEGWRVRKDGSQFSADVVITALREKNGSLRGFAEVARDITERKRAEEELRFRNLLLNTQQEASIDGILVVAETGKMLSFNQRFVEMWDIPPKVVESRSDELALQSVLEKLIGPEEFLIKVKYLYEHPHETSQDEIALRDGRTFDRYSAPMFGTDGRYYGRIWNFRDVSERKKMMEALRESEKGYRNLVETALVGVYKINTQGDILYVNDALARMLGFTSPVEMIAEHAQMRFKYPKDRETLLDLLQRKGRVEGYDAEVLTKKGQSKNVLISALQEGEVLSGMVIDITARKQAERALQKSQARLQLQINRMPIACIVWNTEFRALSWNPAAERIFGFTANEVIGKKPYGLIVQKQIQSEVEKIWERLLKGDSAAHSINENITKDGRTILCDWTNTPLLEDDGTVAGVLSMVQDITEKWKPLEETS